jgi:hypothetical protein
MGAARRCPVIYMVEMALLELERRAEWDAWYVAARAAAAPHPRLIAADRAIRRAHRRARPAITPRGPAQAAMRTGSALIPRRKFE